jgi:hypothetical protein
VGSAPGSGSPGVDCAGRVGGRVYRLTCAR